MRILTLFITIICSFGGYNALAAPEFGKIAVVNPDRVILESSAGKDINKQLEAKNIEFTRRMTAKDKKLQKEKGELEKKQAVLAKAAFEKKVKDFEKKVLAFQKELQEERGKLEKSSKKALEKLDKVAKEVTEEISKEKKFDVVIRQNASLFFKPHMDITDLIIKKMNKKLKKVRLD